ncbi:hypothetical protein PTE30175_05123 [Pandoraea terrae]|uniref:Uncharacterized protein n=1 Tax=Pandoraea terrae TaxID=1537710 RepID=A0A5E4ZAM2_9BURK|nr:flagellar biosynthesis sigma factor [Pandoraea terrae]VVE57652.1 hypothetical protein PTE30175_05123 [Pandoraea terrae]
MTFFRKLLRRRPKSVLVISAALLWGLYTLVRPADIVALTIGEPYEQVRQRTRTTLPPGHLGHYAGGYVERPSILRFTDPQFGFVTPAAKRLFVGYDKHGNVDSVTMWPQTKLLPLDETLKVVTDLQRQFRQGGWCLENAAKFPAIEDTPAMREKMRSLPGPTSYWQGGDKLKASIDVFRMHRDSRPNDERFQITLRLYKSSDAGCCMKDMH